ncbi:MAG: MFS transporter [Rhizobiales bacterium]|nr:MFS transporter [Hyphomicrobiales bacterium]MBI3672228.1 MFS transporter [Hyphomicrobiales bacterium]
MTASQFRLRLSTFNVFLFLGSGIQLPFLPLWLKSRGLEAGEIALVVAAMMAVRVLAFPVGTFIADHTGNRRLVVIVAASASFVCYALVGLMPGFETVLVMATLASAFYAPVGPLAEVLAIEGSVQHGIDYGRIRLWASLSFLLGSLLAGALLEVIPVSFVILVLAGAQGAGALVSLVLPADQHVSRPATARGRRGLLLAFLGSAGFLLLALAAGLGQASHGVFYAFGSVHWDHLGYGKLTIGLLWAAGVLAEVTMFAFSNVFFRRFGAERLIAIGVACGLLRWIVFALNPPLWLWFAAQTLHAGSFGLTHLGTMHFIRQTAPEGLRNTVQGVYSAWANGILLGGFMWWAGPLYGSFGGFAYLVMAGYSAVALLLALLLVRLSPTRQGQAAA